MRAVQAHWATTAGAAVALVVAVAAVTSAKLTIAATVGLLFAAVAVWDFSIGVAVFAFLVFFSRIPALGSTGLTLPKITGALLAGLWVLRVLSRTRRPPVLTRAHPALAYVLIAFAGWAYASLLWATDVGTAFSNASRLAQVIVLAFMVFSAIQERRHLWWLLSAFIVGATLSAFVGLAGVTQPDSPTGAADRLTGGIGDPNELAAILLPALAFALFGLCATRSIITRWLLFGSAVVTAIALFRTESRGGILGLGVMLIAALVFAGPVRARAVAAVLSIAATAVFYFVLLAPPEAMTRLTHFGTGSGRVDLWRVGLKIFENHPVVGVGAGNFQVVDTSYVNANLDLRYSRFILDPTQPVHNTYLQFLVDLGLIGLALFVVTLVACIAVARRAIRTLGDAGDRDLEVLARGIVVGTIGMLAAFTFISANYEKQLPLLLGMLPALLTLARSSQAESTEVEQSSETEFEQMPPIFRRPRMLPG